MLMPVIAEVFGSIGITKDDVDFICSGSTDYLVGGPFSFVTALDAVGVWPPRAESHVEMDGAWALYEAWVLLQEGEIDAALVYSFGRSSLGDLERDPDPPARPLLPRPALAGRGEPRRPAGPGPHRRRQGHRGRLRRRRRPEPARTRLANPNAQVANDVTGRGAARGRLRGRRRSAGTRCRPSPTGPRPSCWPPATRPRRGRSARCGSPGIDHRIETHSLGARDLTTSPSTARAAEEAGVADGPVDLAELHAPFAHQEIILSEALGLDDGGGRQPVGRSRWPPTPSCRPASSASARRPPGSSGRAGPPGGRPRHLRALPPAEPGLRPGG